MISEIKTPVKAGLNQATWDMSQRVRPRTDKEKKQLESRIERFRSFGMSDERMASCVRDKEYITNDAPEGIYTIKAMTGGEEFSAETQILKDHWYK